MERWVRAGRRLARGAAAFVSIDLITGMAAFSLITLGSLWYFCASYLRITSELDARGIHVASALQVFLAWIGVLAAIPVMVATGYLTVRAYAIPRQLYRSMRHPTG